MYFIYVIYSSSSDLYYVGYTDNVNRRLLEHNTDPKNSYTSKYRPWEICVSFPVGNDRGIAMKIEKYIKRLKSRRIIEQLI